ncbi:MAG: anthranilate phosphoribosyltransferase [Bacteroidetes bacterium]|nr:MAG: anthranilate phosphoribosyltransferase [Bacteroidota bacterium]
MNFKDTITYLMEGNRLSTASAYDLMQRIGTGVFTDSQNAALIISLSSRDITLDELMGFRQALLELSLPTRLEQYDTIDLCGTGGDGKNTFNISTLSAFVVAGAGYGVAKHGNYGVSSVSGSSNVLEKVGYKFSNDASKLQRELETVGVCFLHAPLFHPALKNVASVRKELGVKTVFNTLGPLVNPAKNQKQFVGVFNLKLARLYHYLLQQDGKQYAVVHSVDGYDEISLTCPVQYYASVGENLFTPHDLGFETLTQESLFGGDTVEEATHIFVEILQGKGTQAQNNALVVNAGCAIHCFEQHLPILDSIAKAQESLQSGKAYQTFQKLVAMQ